MLLSIYLHVLNYAKKEIYLGIGHIFEKDMSFYLNIYFLKKSVFLLSLNLNQKKNDPIS